MQTQSLLSQIHLRNLQIIQNNPSARKNNRPPNSNRTLMKLYLTRQILEECLHTLDIFKQILDDPVEKNKLIRDVNKNLQLKLYDQGGIIYNKGEVSSCFYMVIKGKVSLCMPNYRSQNQGRYQIYQEEEIDSFGEGIGFGQAEFIHGRKRSLIAKAKVNDTVVGMIEGLAFQEIIELYKQRVYFKKIEMFSKCPLLKNLPPNQLQFIVNNAKPMNIPISRQIVKQNEKPKALYLIIQGQVQLRRNNPLLQDQKKGFKYQLNSRKSLQDVAKQKIKLKNIVVGVLEEGQFIGDSQLAMNIPYAFSAQAKSEKTRLYMCDQRIIVTQMTQQLFTSAFQYYKNKINYHQNKPEIYHNAKSKLQIRLDNQEKIFLSLQQMKKKRMILNRYVQDSTTLIGRLSPRQITKIVNRKYERMKSEPSKKNNSKNSHYFPQLNIIIPSKNLKPNQRAYSPLLKKSRSYQNQQYTSDISESKRLHPTRKDQSYKYQVINSPFEFQRSQSRPVMLIMKPFVKKVLSLHQRLTQQYNRDKSQDTNESKTKKSLNDKYSIIQMRRVYQFINKIKAQKKKN